MKKPSFLIISIIVGIVGGILYFNSLPDSQAEPSVKGVKAIVYKSPTCGCCGNYASYLRRRGYDVEIQNVQNTSEIKTQFGIPPNLLSCHTTVIDNYVIEGHIPTETIDKLFAEKPAIAGIGMAGMPSGSPGMPGAKFAPFEIHSINPAGQDAGIFTEM